MNKITNSVFIPTNCGFTKHQILSNNFENYPTVDFKPNISDKKNLSSSITDMNLNAQYINNNCENNTKKNTNNKLNNSVKKEKRWFSILDKNGKEAFIHTRKDIKLNKNGELVVNHYRLLDTNNNTITIDDEHNVVIQPDNVIIITKKNDESEKNVTLSKLKSMKLNDSNVIKRKNNKIYDLNDSGLEKYKENEIDIMKGNISYNFYEKNNINLANNLIKMLNSIELFKFNTKNVLNSNEDEKNINNF